MVPSENTDKRVITLSDRFLGGDESQEGLLASDLQSEVSAVTDLEGIKAAKAMQALEHVDGIGFRQLPCCANELEAYLEKYFAESEK